jgi:hypothetical protein
MEGFITAELFWMVEAALFTGGLALAGVLYRRQDRLEGRLVSLDDKVQTVAHQAASRHDTGLGDVWQALEDYRTESRRNAAEAEKHSREFREATLRQLGTIEATLARLEARLPRALPHPGE